jgi:hypothetical protein
MRTISIPIYKYLFLLLLSSSIIVNVHGRFSIERIRECVKDEEVLGRKIKNVEGTIFNLHYGDPAVEVFNIVSSKDMRKLVYLNKCVKLEDSSLFEDRTHLKDAFLLHAGSNITHLTGIFNQIFPEMRDKVINGIKEGIKGAKWGDVNQADYMGIRSVKYLSFQAETPMKSREELNEERIARLEEAKYFKIQPAKLRNYSQYDPDADENVLKFMTKSDENIYDATIIISDRAKFSGASLLIKKSVALPWRPGSVMIEDEEEDEYEDDYGDESFDIDETEDARKSMIDSAKALRDKLMLEEAKENNHTTIEPIFNAVTTKIGRYTPDRSNMLLVKSDHLHGMQPVLRGKREVLYFEFWSYADAEPGEINLSVKDAKPHPKSLEDKEEL